MKRRTHKRTMAELRWITMCFSLILGLQITAVTGQRYSFSNITVRAGDDITLSCTYVIDGQHECDSTDWFFHGSRDTLLVRRGKIVKKDDSTSDRLSVTESCSLVLKKVSAGDAGRFQCHQIRSERRQHSTEVYLSVVTMTEQKVGKNVILNCSVSSYGDCKDKVRWMFRGNPVDKDLRDLKTSQSGCSATVSFSKTHFISNNSNDFLNCEVTGGSSENKHQVTFSPRSSVDSKGDRATVKPGGGRATVKPGGGRATDEPAASDCSAVTFIMLLMRVAELLLLTVITVLLIRAAVNQRAPERSPAVRRSGAAATQVNRDEDEDEGPVDYENSVRRH